MENRSVAERLWYFIQVGKITELNFNRDIDSESIECCFHSNKRRSDYIRALTSGCSWSEPLDLFCFRRRASGYLFLCSRPQHRALYIFVALVSWKTSA